jgi:hypothetical protein
MEEQTSSIDTALLCKLKSLARRGAVLWRTPCGGGVVGQQGGRAANATPHRPQLSASEVAAALRDEWLTEWTAEGFVLSTRAASLLRVVLSRPAQPDETYRIRQAGANTRHSTRSASVGGSLSAPPALETTDRTTRPGFSACESPLGWLRRHGSKTGTELISAAEFDAGERLRTDFHMAQMLPRVTASWDLATPAMRQRTGGPAAGLETSEAAVAARQRVEAALKAVGPEMAGVLIDVCCFLKGIEQAERNGGWPRRAGKVVLRLALAQLARHYGIGNHSGPARSRILHWGADGYRPDIDGSELDKAS